jgi:glutamyl-tRNA reductase
MDRLLLLGLSHTTAPLEVRERLAFNPRQREAALAAFKEKFAHCELVVLSTCNRVEFYAAREVHGTPRYEDLVEFIAAFHSLSAQQFTKHLYQKADHDLVVHLFHVASSLDSMVLGETQILGQVREAYEAASHAGTVGPLLNPLFQKAIAVGKQVMHDTPLSEGRLSVASVAVDYAKGIFDHFNDKTVLTIGAGKMARLVLQHFKSLGPKKLLICNRDPEKAANLAAEFGGEPAAFERLSDHLVAADIVLSSTGAAHPIITKSQFESLRRPRRYRPIFLIDIAVPRDVEAAVGNIEGVYLYNLDDLQQVVSETQAQRKDVIEAARKIVLEQVETFVTWHRQRQLGPAIRRLYERYHTIAQEELARTLHKLPNLSDAEKAHLEDLSRRIVNKLLHDPVHTLRNNDATHIPAAQYLHALEKLFALSPEDWSIREDQAPAEPPESS